MLPQKWKSIQYFRDQNILKSRSRAVGHLPQEISRITKYLLERGAEIEVQLTSSQYRSSPITHCGQENHVES